MKKGKKKEKYASINYVVEIKEDLLKEITDNKKEQLSKINELKVQVKEYQK